MTSNSRDTLDRLLRKSDIVGRKPVTAEEAATNRLKGVGPRRARPGKAGLLPVSPATLDRMIASGLFPRGTRLSNGVVAWPESVVAEFIRSRVAAGKGR